MAKKRPTSDTIPASSVERIEFPPEVTRNWRIYCQADESRYRANRLQDFLAVSVALSAIGGGLTFLRTWSALWSLAIGVGVAAVLVGSHLAFKRLPARPAMSARERNAILNDERAEQLHRLYGLDASLDRFLLKHPTLKPFEERDRVQRDLETIRELSTVLAASFARSGDLGTVHTIDGTYPYGSQQALQEAALERAGRTQADEEVDRIVRIAAQRLTK